MAKRHGGLWPLITSEENLMLAYCLASRGKKRMRNVARFAENLDENIAAIRDKLVSKTFSTSPYQQKMVHVPKTRVIYVLPFSPDRIVQHALMNIVGPIWDRLMINESYACRPGKGQHAGSRKAMEFVRRYAYFLQCDIAKFYPSIDHEIAARIVRKKIKCVDTLWLLDDIIYSFPGGKNAPIGNYTSQWLGNLYLSELDRFVKDVLRVKGYVRYCDDFILFSDNKAELHQFKEEIRDFLMEKLQLSYSYAEVNPVKNGLDFLGYRHFRTHILLRKSTAVRVRRRLSKLPSLLASGKVSADQARSSIASTRGWLKWACTHNLAVSLHLDLLEKHCEGQQI